MEIADFLVSLFSATQDAQLRKTETPALEIPENLTTTEKKLA